jgi:hypothetical protein
MPENAKNTIQARIGPIPDERTAEIEENFMIVPFFHPAILLVMRLWVPFPHFGAVTHYKAVFVIFPFATAILLRLYTRHHIQALGPVQRDSQGFGNFPVRSCKTYHDFRKTVSVTRHTPYPAFGRRF